MKQLLHCTKCSLQKTVAKRLLALLLLYTISVPTSLALEEDTYEFGAYADTLDGSAEISIFSRFYMDPADLYADDSYLEEDYPIPTEVTPVLETMLETLEQDLDSLAENFTVEESMFLLDEEDDWYVSIGVDLENNMTEVLFDHTFITDTDNPDELFDVMLEELHSITMEDLEEHYTYYFIEEQSASVYGVVVITDLFGKDEESVFSDVDSDYEYFDAINYVEVYGIVEGYSDGTYRPEKEINRAEFTKILIEARYPGEATTGEDCFSDIAADQWYAKYVCFAKDEGIISGYSDGSFKPAQSINIAEALKITLETYFPGYFEEETDPWYEKYWDYADDTGYLLDEWDSASENLSRGAMAELIYRIE